MDEPTPEEIISNGPPTNWRLGEIFGTHWANEKGTMRGCELTKEEICSIKKVPMG